MNKKKVGTKELTAAFNKFLDTFKEQQESLLYEIADLEATKAKLQAEIDEMNRLKKEWGSVIKLNVGGQHFATSKANLLKYPTSMLGTMFSGRHTVVEDEKGRVFIDRDPKLFRHVLAFLRDGEDGWEPPSSPSEQRKLQMEFKFFQLEYPLSSKVLNWKFRQSPTALGPLIVAEDGLTVSCSANVQVGSAYVLGDTCFSGQGTYRWKVTILALSSACIEIGVCQEPLSDSTRWGCSSEQTCCKMEGVVQRWQSGEQLFCQLDMDEGTFELYNATKTTSLSASGLKGMKLFPVVGMNKSGEKVQISFE